MQHTKATILFLFFLLTISCRSLPEQTYKFNGFTMGTSYHITIYTDKIKQPNLKSIINNTLKEINLRMSTYDSNSEISKFNNWESTNWFKLSTDTFMVITQAMDICRKTVGIYDITAGPLINLWGFGAGKGEKKIPSKKDISIALSQTGYHMLKTKNIPPSIKKENPKIFVDLASTAKGYGVDQISHLLNSLGYSNTLVDIGGEVKATGKKGGNNWRIGVMKPLENITVASSKDIGKVITLNNQSIATSGDYQNFFKTNNILYSHIINTKTGYPIHHPLASVSVINKSCMIADAWATAILALGIEDGFKLAKKENLAIYLITRNNTNKIKEYISEDFKKYIQNK